MKLLRPLPLLLFWLSQAVNGALLAVDPPSPGLKRARLHVMASESMFATVNRADATASMTIWTRQIAGIYGFELDTRMEIARSIEEIRQRLKAHTVDLLVLDTPDFLALVDGKLIEALVAGTSRGRLGTFPYLLLTNAAPEAGQLAGLRGKRIVVNSRTKSNLGLAWLETLLAENRLGRASGFFGSLEIGYRASACVLPLFFGKIDACVVDSDSWESIKELNPQLGRLRVAARSEALLEGVMAVPVAPFPYKSVMIESIINMHKTAAGEQLGIVFRTGPLIRVVKEQFESVRALRGKYRRIVEPSGDGPAPIAGRLEEVEVKERR